MSRIFSWKNRLLGRKTPEPEKALQVSLPRDNVAADAQPPPPPRRSVRFDEARNEFKPIENGYPEPEWQNEYGEARVIGSVSPANGSSRNAIMDSRAGNWQYADDVRVSIAPLAASEDDETTRPRPSRAGTVLQSLREQRDYVDYSERLHNGAANVPAKSGSLPGGYIGFRPMSPATRPAAYSNRPPEAPFRSRDPYREESPYMSRSQEGVRNQLEEMNVVFLQANDEIKRIILPPDVQTMYQIKMAFVRAFPNLTRSFIEQPQVKIYIQEPTKGQLFYELDDPRDIKNKSVLKLREHSHGMTSPSPARFHDQPDYHSETEFDDGRNRMLSQFRPASAMADFGPPKPIRQKSFDQYASNVDPYSSDASSHDSRSVTRSGSATPVIDRESKARMETMERQLAGLSSLVHSALVSKGMSENTQKDMADLRREILALHPETVREVSEEPSSIPESISSHTHHQLGTLKNSVQQANNEMRQLRRTAQINAVSARTMIRDAGDQISHLINERIGGSRQSDGERPGTQREDREREEHSQRLANLLEQLTSFENNVESVRSSVLQSNKKLRMSEVEQLTEHLTEIGRSAATLKTEFPSIQSIIEAKIKADMERIVREEKYIRDQTAAVDQSLRRCKGLANIMVTMKKLAMVQDPSIHKSKKHDPSTVVSSQSSTPVPPSPHFVPPSPNEFVPTVPYPPQMNGPPADPATERPAPFTPTVPPKTQQKLTATVPPVPPSPANYQSDASSLDGILDEVSHSQAGMPPRPPSRYSVNDVRDKFNKPPELPEQIKSIIDDVARRASPSIDKDSAERRQDLEERQQRLTEKQRQLRNQFQQLQQLTPLP